MWMASCNSTTVLVYPTLHVVHNPPLQRTLIRTMWGSGAGGMRSQLLTDAEEALAEQEEEAEEEEEVCLCFSGLLTVLLCDYESRLWEYIICSHIERGGKEGTGVAGLRCGVWLCSAAWLRLCRSYLI